jgi:hypothetical protein
MALLQLPKLITKVRFPSSKCLHLQNPCFQGRPSQQRSLSFEEVL